MTEFQFSLNTCTELKEIMEKNLKQKKDQLEDRQTHAWHLVAFN